MPNVRAEDHGRLAAWWGRWGRDLTVLASVALSGWAVFVTQSHVDDLTSESTQRRDQACIIFERQEQSDIAALKQTYGYLAGLSRSELHEPLNRTILANLSQVELAAQTPDAPGYCHKPGVGLPEPRGGLKTKHGLLVIPRRPPNLPPR